MITFPHAVIYDGVFYPANTPIEDKSAVEEPKADEKTADEEKAGAENANRKPTAKSRARNTDKR